LEGEIHFRRRHGRGMSEMEAETGTGAGAYPAKRSVGRSAFFAGASNQISLMKWVNSVETPGSEKTGIRALFS